MCTRCAFVSGLAVPGGSALLMDTGWTDAQTTTILDTRNGFGLGMLAKRGIPGHGRVAGDSVAHTLAPAETAARA